tara:strand:- start:19654 stop:20508 length:855 start_codon:yes stop_codon:yes gene_type:complete
MSDENAVTLESAAAPEVQAEAQKLGWIPPDRYKGEADNFVDAEEYLKRGETVLPIVKAQNAKLRAEVETLRASSATTQSALVAAQKAIEEIEERHSVATQKAVEQARRDVKAQLEIASEAGDHRGVADLTDQLVQLNKADPPTAKKTFTPPAQLPAPDPALVAWQEDNPWFTVDRRKTALALGIAEDLRANGEKATGRAFYDIVSVELDKELGPKYTPTSKVESGKNGGTDDGPRSGKKGFSSLPSDARAACNADTKKFVGDGKRYKTAAEWQSRYAELYFESQ